MSALGLDSVVDGAAPAVLDGAEEVVASLGEVVGLEPPPGALEQPDRITVVAIAARNMVPRSFMGPTVLLYLGTCVPGRFNSDHWADYFSP